MTLLKVATITAEGDTQKNGKEIVFWVGFMLGTLLSPLMLSFSLFADSHFQTPSWCCGRTVCCNRRWGLPPGEPCELTPGWLRSVCRHFRTRALAVQLKLDVLSSLFCNSYCNLGHCLGHLSAAILSAGWHSSLRRVSGACVGVCPCAVCVLASPWWDKISSSVTYEREWLTLYKMCALTVYK